MIPAFVPALTLAGVCCRSSMTRQDVMNLDAKERGFVTRQARAVQSQLYAQLRKRYLVDSLGQVMGPPSGAGTAPPPVIFSGVPTSGDLEIVLTVTTPGPVGVSLFSWSKDAGLTQSATGVATETAVSLPGTGLTAKFPALIGSSAAYYSSDNIYTSSTPIVEALLQWIVDVLTPRLWDRRGVNASNDDQIKEARDRRDKAEKFVNDCADMLGGLWELSPNTDLGGTGATQTAPLFHSQSSPFAWMDYSRSRGRREDSSGRNGGGFLG